MQGAFETTVLSFLEHIYNKLTRAMVRPYYPAPLRMQIVSGHKKGLPGHKKRGGVAAVPLFYGLIAVYFFTAV